MESLTYFKDIKETPKKLRLYLNIIKQMSPQAALDYLLYAPHKQGRIYYKVLHSAIANATNTLKVSADVLKFKLFTIEEGHSLRRFNAGSRGSAKPMKRRFAHIKIILIEDPKSKAKPKKIVAKAESKTEKKAEAKSEVKVESKPKTPRVKKTEVKKVE